MKDTNNKPLLEQIIDAGVKLTPMMQQYHEIKSQYPGILLMFRMGDFYELFFEDAQNASKILNISLTHRGKLGDFKIPMAGIPHHAASTYIDRITALGMKVAICEQTEDPKAAKGIVKRAVTQVVSPGMPFDLDKSEQNENSFMACGYKFNNGFYLVLIDYTTGDFFGLALPDEGALVEKLSLYRPKEILCYLGQWDNHQLMQDYISKTDILKTHLSFDYFEEKYTSLYIEKLIKTYKRDEVIKLHKEIISPIGALSYYICSTQSVENLDHIRPFQILSFEEEMKITYPTLVGLEILPKNRETYKDSILGFIDSTQCALGARKLKMVFQNPLRSIERIKQRQNAVKFFLENMQELDSVREKISNTRDIERIMAKVSTGKVNGGDLINLSNAYTEFSSISSKTKKALKAITPQLSKKESESLKNLSQKIIDTINDEIGANLDKGNLIKPGSDKKRDALKELTTNASSKLVALETRYRSETGIPNLRVKHNNIAGYFIEVSKSHTNKVPKNFVRRQTLVNSERYQSEELAEFEKEMFSAKDKLQKLERKIFEDIVEIVKTNSQGILNLANAIALTDVFQSFAWSSMQHGFSAPKLSENKKLLEIKEAWHPLIKVNIKDQFVAHNLTLNKESFFGLITGPNMAGKTTVMREMAIIQFLAQIGSYVPAASANLGVCDYIFSRLGASDDIIKGQSTFMVEMSETAEIIRHASENSLIVLDEIGRGTSTYDGLSIAWSLVEYFVNKTKCLTLFSTHYHELIELVHDLKGAKNLTVKTTNTDGHIEFLYELIEQGAAQSFGIHVAKLAGLPKEILTRSQQILSSLEAENHSTPIKENSQLSIFEPINVSNNDDDSKIRSEIEALDILNMTPLQAMNKLHEMQSMLLS